MTYEEFNKWITNNQGFIHIHEEHMDIGGGQLNLNDIDQLKQYENIDKVMISGLHQDSFEYFINYYGKKIKYLKFFKNKMIEDLSSLSRLENLVYVDFFSNQRITKLWDMRRNIKLEGICLEDCTRLHSLEGVQTAAALKHIRFGDKIWSSSILTDLDPLTGTKIISFSFTGKSIEKNDIFVYKKIPTLKYLDFPTNLYTTEQIAQIMARSPQLQGYALKPFIKFERNTMRHKDVLVCGKRKPFLSSSKDKEKIRKYTEKFNTFIDHYKNEIVAQNEEKAMD